MSRDESESLYYKYKDCERFEESRALRAWIVIQMNYCEGISRESICMCDKIGGT
jgi:hypothetical protein